MAINGANRIGFLQSVEVFADTMGERFTDHDPDNCLIIIARDKDHTLEIMFGDNDEALVDALSTALYQSQELCAMVTQALGIVMAAKIRNQNRDQQPED